MNVNDLIKTPLEEITFSVVDTETTGMNARLGKIIDIGIVKLRNGKILSTFESLIDPKEPISYWITRYTNLEDEDVKGKPTFSRLAKRINRMISNTIFVGHNASFDYSFISNEMQKCKVEFFCPKICTVMLGRKLLPQLAHAHLDALSDYYGIKVSQRHRALPDALATAAILKEFIKIAKKKYHAKNYFDLERLQRISINKRTEGQNEGLILFKSLKL